MLINAIIVLAGVLVFLSIVVSEIVRTERLLEMEARQRAAKLAIEERKRSTPVEE